MSTFNESNDVGKMGEQTLCQYWSSKGYQVVDLSAHKLAQSMDIDYAVQTHRGSYLVDVKTDTHFPNNFFIEIVSNNNSHSEGCIYQTKADRWYYYFPNHGVCYVFAPEDMRKLIADNDFRQVTTSTRGYNGDVLYNTVGVLVPVNLCKVVQHKFRPKQLAA